MAVFLSLLKQVPTLIASLPAILKLLQTIADAIKENDTKIKVKEGVQNVHEAIAKGDNEKLNALFTITK